LRIVFMGTPSYAVPSLRALLEAGHTIAGVFTQPDKPSGRGHKFSASLVKRYALEHGLPVFQPARIRKDGVDDLRSLRPDLCVTAAFGQILSQEILDIPKAGTVNVHASLLPEYRGSAPIAWCLINGETRTGVTTMMTDKGIDTGDILLRHPVDILPLETAGELTERLAKAGAVLLMETLDGLERGDCPREKQNELKATYFPMLKKETGLVRFDMPARMIFNLVRGVSPWPGAYAYAPSGVVKLIKVSVETCSADAVPGMVLEADAKRGLLVKAGIDAIRVDVMQTAGCRSMAACSFLCGHEIQAGDLWRSEEYHA
jgi:methionyl-tRNA formyltransferase